MGRKDADDDGRKKPDWVGSIIDAEKEEEDEEALSLSDLPIDEEKNHHQSIKETPKQPFIDSQEEFNFCSSLGDSCVSKESEMCVADEVFFQGQILPLRHSLSSASDSGLITKLQSDISRQTSRSISRSESMDHCYSIGFTSLSSRSSSINSHHSSSSGSSGNLGTTPGSKPKPRPKIRNQFQYSHPSPKPQIHSSNIKNGINNNSNRNSSTIWSIFRVGLVTTPEIAMQDLKFRTKVKRFGSRNSASSISSSLSSSSNCRIIRAEKEQKQQKKFFDKNGVLFSGCKCSSNAVVGPIPSRASEKNVIRESCSVNESHAQNEEEKEKPKATKQSLSRHRTFEWLKQLSLETAAAVVIDEA